MNTVKETTLHPDGNGGVDLYPKTNINQVQELPQKLTSVENKINQLNIGKLTKPTNPSAESAVTMLADGTVGTKPLSEIGGGGKLYSHDLSFYIDSSGLKICNILIINSKLDTITPSTLSEEIDKWIRGKYSLLPESSYIITNIKNEGELGISISYIDNNSDANINFNPTTIAPTSGRKFDIVTEL